MIALLLIAQVIVTAPPLSPEQAVAVLRADHLASDMTNIPLYPIGDGPKVVVITSGPTLGPWDWPTRRLDGTPLWYPLTLSRRPWIGWRQHGPIERWTFPGSAVQLTLPPWSLTPVVEPPPPPVPVGRAERKRRGN